MVYNDFQKIFARSYTFLKFYNFFVSQLNFKMLKIFW